MLHHCIIHNFGSIKMLMYFLPSWLAKKLPPECTHNSSTGSFMWEKRKLRDELISTRKICSHSRRGEKEEFCVQFPLVDFNLDHSGWNVPQPSFRDYFDETEN